MQQEAVLWKALMSAYYGEERAEALEEAGAEPEARPSPALSELSGEPGVEELQAVLQESYNPRKEGMEAFEARINRAAEGLQMLGIEVVDRQAEILLEANAIKEVYGVTGSLEPTVMVRTARDFFVGVSVDPAISDLERRNRAQGYASLIRTFGGKTSTDPTKLFSTPSLSKEVGGGLAVSAGRPKPEESDRLRSKVTALELELEEMRRKMADGGEAESVAPSAMGSGGGKLELTEVLKEQTEVLKQAFSGNRGSTSITTVKTDLHWPTLSDDLTDVKDVAEFYEAFEDNCGLANNCQGMSKREMLVALRSRCRGSRLKTFQNIYRQEFKSGAVGSDADSVYEKIKSKHLLFSESCGRTRDQGGFGTRRSDAGHQFEPLFERSIAELEEIGLGKTPRELFLSYLRKVGPVLQKEIRRDKRIWPKESELRAPRTWEEAHKVVLEYEQRESTNRAQVSSVYVAEDGPRRQPKGGDSVLNTDTGKGVGKKSKICFHFRDHGNCPKGDKCEYTPMTRSCVRKLLRSSVLAETVLGPRLIVVAKAVREKAVERETAEAGVAVQAVDGLDVVIVRGGEETRLEEAIGAVNVGTSKESCVLTS